VDGSGSSDSTAVNQGEEDELPPNGNEGERYESDEHGEDYTSYQYKRLKVDN
jgi:hypothetical protein